ncbi:MAG TPA: hypothetical protein VMS37_08370, partial [Verrucomicrobiae bacterium]|nr:hypothetical protein [Verrucomicrobiae bacterium]
MRMLACVLAACAVSLAQSPAPKLVTWTGWFADEGLGHGSKASPRGRSGTLPHDYSQRRAIMGSTREARRAGSQPAAI